MKKTLDFLSICETGIMKDIIAFLDAYPDTDINQINEKDPIWLGFLSREDCTNCALNKAAFNMNVELFEYLISKKPIITEDYYYDIKTHIPRSKNLYQDDDYYRRLARELCVEAHFKLGESLSKEEEEKTYQDIKEQIKKFEKKYDKILAILEKAYNKNQV